MSNIVEKKFDALKKIFRTVFKGSPNLLTSADLNRQIEALKYQLDTLDRKTGVLSDIKITFDVKKTLVQVEKYSYIEALGCSFRPPISSYVVPFTEDKYYVVLTAKSKIVTYDDDITHEISGAKFSDGTSQPAANQYVYHSEAIKVVTDLENTSDVIAVLAVIAKKADSYIMASNCLTKVDSVMTVKKSDIIEGYDSEVYGVIQDGDTIEQAIAKSVNNIKVCYLGGSHISVLESAMTISLTKDLQLQPGDFIDVWFLATLEGELIAEYLYAFSLIYSSQTKTIFTQVGYSSDFWPVRVQWNKDQIDVINLRDSAAKFASIGGLTIVYHRNIKDRQS